MKLHHSKSVASSSVASVSYRNHDASTAPHFEVLRHQASRQGFSLLEMLTVMSIMVLLGALLAPAVMGFTSTAGRRGAVNLVMNTIDQARVAALEQGRSVHVVFAQRQFPDPDSILILREDELGQPTEQLTRWITLPRGVVFMNSGLFETSSPGVTAEALPGDSDKLVRHGVLTFSPRGTVQFPTGGDDNRRRIKLVDGVRHGEAAPVAKTDGFDIISVARFTGRPQLDVSF